MVPAFWDLADMPPMLRQRQFDHVIANPPYFPAEASTVAEDEGRDLARREHVTSLANWVQAAARRTAPKGTVSFIQRAERLPELLCLAQDCLGSIEVLPLIPRRGRDARLFILRARKNGRAGFRLHDGWVLHDGPRHEQDAENYTRATGSVLRAGAPLIFG